MAKQTFTTGQVLTAAQMTSLQQTAMGGGAATAKTASYVLTAADAGTVVQMNAAGATTITVNTALFAAGDTVQIQNIGAGVCTVTAGTATVTTAGSLALSQWEGGNLYFTSTSASIFFDIVQSSGMTNPMTTTGDTIYSSSGSTPARLGIGTAGQVLKVNSGATAPEWANASAGGGWQVVKAETTFTSVASTGTTFDSIFSSSYNYYMVEIKALGGGTAATDDLQLQMLYSGTTQAAGYYGTSIGCIHSASTISNNGTSGATQFLVAPDSCGNATTGDRITGVMNFYQCQGTSATAAVQGQLLAGYNYGNWTFAGQSSVARTFTGFLLKCSSGNISGTLAVYGLA